MSQQVIAHHQPINDWPQTPTFWELAEVSDVAVDSEDRVWVFNRGDHPLMVFDRNGLFVNAWGEGLFSGPHGITIDSQDNVYLVDRFAHVVMKLTPDGELLLELGNRNEPSPTYYGQPFNMPTAVAVAPSGVMYVADGYGNRRVHKYSPEGDLITSWGEPGSDPGQFALVHGIALDSDEHIYVCDRENSRVQVFDEQGNFLIEWRDCYQPQALSITTDGLAYVAEKGLVEIVGQNNPQTETRVTVRDLDGEILNQWSEPLDRPHGIDVNSLGDVIIADLAGRAQLFKATPSGDLT